MAEILDRHQDLVYCFYLKRVGRQEAPDLLQTWYVKVIQAWAGKSYTPHRGSYRSLLLRIAWTIWVDAGTPPSRTPTALEESVEGVVPTPEQTARDRDQVRCALLLMERLPEKQRKALLLKIQDFSTEEIASVLGVKTGTVHNLIFQARKSLRASVEESDRWGSRRL